MSARTKYVWLVEHREGPSWSVWAVFTNAEEAEVTRYCLISRFGEEYRVSRMPLNPNIIGDECEYLCT